MGVGRSFVGLHVDFLQAERGYGFWMSSEVVAG
jgi:hypothetical protein